MLKYKITADFDEWEKVCEQITGYLQNKGVEQKKIVSFIVAAEEIFVNISEYAYNGNAGDVFIQAEMLDENVFKLDFYDLGVPFNPLEIEMPDTSASTIHRKTGGLGIYMARQKTDEMRYEYIDNKNHLSLIKKM